MNDSLDFLWLLILSPILASLSLLLAAGGPDAPADVCRPPVCLSALPCIPAFCVPG